MCKLIRESSRNERKTEKFKFAGKISIWKYLKSERSFYHWNFNADKLGQTELLGLLKTMEDCEWSTQKKISVSPPTPEQLSIPNIRGGKAEWKTRNCLILNSKKNMSENHWQIIESEFDVEIQFEKAKLIEFKNAIIKRAKGEIDFAICDSVDENILYFW